jgi:hypothetical protein
MMALLGRLVGVLVVALAVLACTSPEATRMRSGGPGADPGNRRAKVVRMHEGSQPYWRTPRRLARSVQAPIDIARQADRQSRRAPEPSAATEPK